MDEPTSPLRPRQPPPLSAGLSSTALLLQPFYRGASTRRQLEDVQAAPLKGKCASFVRGAVLSTVSVAFPGLPDEPVGRRGEPRPARPEGHRDSPRNCSDSGGRSRTEPGRAQPGAPCGNRRLKVVTGLPPRRKSGSRKSAQKSRVFNSTTFEQGALASRGSRRFMA